MGKVGQTDGDTAAVEYAGPPRLDNFPVVEVQPACSVTAAERFAVTAGRCALHDGTRPGGLAREWTQSTCQEAGHCLLTGLVADNVEAMLSMPTSKIGGESGSD